MGTLVGSLAPLAGAVSSRRVLAFVCPRAAMPPAQATGDPARAHRRPWAPGRRRPRVPLARWTRFRAPTMTV
jgi:hypothetical protein